MNVLVETATVHFSLILFRKLDILVDPQYHCVRHRHVESRACSVDT